MEERPNRDSDLIGYTIGEASTTQAYFISKNPPVLGQYVTMEYAGRRVLGMVQSCIRGSVSLSGDLISAEAVERIKEVSREGDHYIKGAIKILGDVERGEMPRIPPPPATEVRKAGNDLLRSIFSRSDAGVRIGVLVSHPEVPVYLDVNKMVTRHLAILAITGAGKSNAVAVIAEGIAKLGGSVVIFDMHSEYVTMDGAHVIKPVINYVNDADLAELLRLMNVDEGAYKQAYYFRKAYKELKCLVFKGSLEPEKFLDGLKVRLTEYAEQKNFSKDRGSIFSVINKIEDMEERYGSILSPRAPSVASSIRLGRVNVVDLGGIDEEGADVIVSHYLKTLLKERKKYYSSGGREGLKFPVFVVLEEAHILAPKDRRTLSKYWISRVAREGRKFGVGLCLVSQRPKALDADALSQTNNKIVLKLVEPSDQRYVQQTSELMSEDLVSQLPSLNIGEAIVLGLMVKFPALVKIDLRKVSGKEDVVAEWRKAKEEEEGVDKEFNDLYEDW